MVALAQLRATHETDTKKRREWRDSLFSVAFDAKERSSTQSWITGGAHALEITVWGRMG